MNEGHAATPKASGLERAVSMPTARSEEARRDEEDVRDEASDDDGDGGDDAPRLREYPSLERLGMYDEDDLDTDGVFVLVRPPKTVHVWIGAGGDTGGEDPDVFGGRAGGGVRGAVGRRRRFGCTWSGKAGRARSSGTRSRRDSESRFDDGGGSG